jgi:hypothetical protein
MDSYDQVQLWSKVTTFFGNAMGRKLSVKSGIIALQQTHATWNSELESSTLLG